VFKILIVNNLITKPVPSMQKAIYLINNKHVSDTYDIILNNVKFKYFFTANNQVVFFKTQAVISLC